MALNISKVSKFTIESFLISNIEEISIFHPTEFYDRVFVQNSVTFYKLKYVKEMQGLDVSFSLIPVVGKSALYVNPKTKPLDLNKYLYQATGKLAKRITIPWAELEQMKSTEQDFFIAVSY